MENLKHKYQEEYENSICFWGKEPAKYVKLLAEHLNFDLENLRVLDLGAGEGKNAVYLANLGAEVLAIDLSEIALDRFSKQPNFEKVKSRITTKVSDIRSLDFNEEKFDIIVAYGILHCMNDDTEIKETASKIRRWLKNGGYFVCATFTDEIPLPSFQNYLDEEALLEKGALQKMFDSDSIISDEDGVITETHSTSKIEHQHSIVRIIIKKQ